MRKLKHLMKWLLIGSVAGVLAFGFIGCAEKKEEAKAPAPAAPAVEKTLVFGRGGDSVGLDPAYETDGNSFMVCDNIYEALVAYADESTALEPGLAESWDISSDGKTYTFKLRKGVKFHDGTPFNSNAVVFFHRSDDERPQCEIHGRRVYDSAPGASARVLGIHGNG